MLKISLLFKKFTTSRANNLRMPKVKSAKFSGYCFFMNINIKGDFQVRISVPLKFLNA